MKDCIFCAMSDKKMPADVVYEDDVLFAVRDIRPKAPIHILIIPREHIPSVDALEDARRDIVARLITTARDIAREKNLNGYKLVFNVGREGGQTIDHLHLHLLGGWGNGEGRVEAVPV